MTMKEIYRPSLWFQLLLACVVGILVYSASVHTEDAEDWMPDAHLEQAVRKALDIPDGIPIHPADMAALTVLLAERDIESLKGLEYAINLEFLHISRCEVSELTPLAGLENLQVLKLYNNRITDITPLSGLVNLQHLGLQSNQISDITPLSGLVNLRHLKIHGNQISDISPLAGLVNLQELVVKLNQVVDVSPLAGLIGLRHLNLEHNFISDLTPLVPLTNLEILLIFGNPIPLGNQFTVEIPHLKAAVAGAICEMPVPSYTTSVTERINTRNYPSAFLSHKRAGDPEQYPSTFDQFIRYDFSFRSEPFHPLTNLHTFNSPFGGAVRGGDLGAIAKLPQVHRDAIRENPNMIFIVEIAYFDGRFLNLPDDSPYWFRNDDGSIAFRERSIDPFGNEQVERLVNFTHPDVIEIIIQRIIAIAKCGLYDGIWLDRWHPDFGGELSHLVTPEDERNARLQILQGIRANVREDFLIIINSRREFPHLAPYINGVFIEAHEPNPVYTYKDLYRFENLIKWYESNLREPAFTLLWGQAAHKPPRSQRVMRLFTTLSLTHSDGYVSLSAEPHPLITYYYDFWDADLGRPVGGDETKGVLYETPKGVSINGLFIREFTNGWAVYNRSGKAQEIELPQAVSGWSSGVEHQRRHTLADLDGEIYLKSETPPTADLNGDGVVNIQDLVIVANAFGEAEPDLNGDGVVNIQDLVIVANAF